MGLKERKGLDEKKSVNHIPNSQNGMFRGSEGPDRVLMGRKSERAYLT